MKKIIMILFVAFAFTNVVHAVEEYWVDIDFTRDSTMWKDAFPELAVSGLNLQSSPNGTYLGYSCRGAFGKFAVSNYVYTPLNRDNTDNRFIYAFRVSNATTNHWTFPEIADAGILRVHVLSGNATTAGVLPLQINTATGEEPDNWVNLDPAVDVTAPPHAFSDTSFIYEKVLNMTGPVKLRFRYSSSVNVHIYAITISKKGPLSNVSTNEINKMQLNLSGRSLHIANLNVDYKASIYNLAGVQIGQLQKGRTFDFQSPGHYIVKIETAEKTFTRKIVVF